MNSKLRVEGWGGGSLASSSSSHVPLWVLFYFHDAGGGSKPKGREIPTFAFYTPRKVTRFPVGHSFKQKYPFLSPCEAIILFTSRRMYGGGGVGGGRWGVAEMSEKCQMPAGSVQFISPSEMFTPGKRVPAGRECAAPPVDGSEQSSP